MSDPPLHVVMIAGEASGDILGADLMAALREKHPNISFSGVGGAHMQAQGISSLFEMSEIALMGITSILPKIPSLLRRIRETRDHILAVQPDFVICIDAPDFNHRVAKQVKAKAPNIKIVNYVPPTVWFWRPKRAKKIRQFFDLALAIFPFEPAVMKRLGGPDCTYVGHPAANAVATRAEGEAFRKKYKISPSDKLISVLPGSRNSEVKQLGSIFGDTVKALKKRYPDLRIAVPIVPHLRARVGEIAASWSDDIILVEGESQKAALFSASDAALAASGTVAIELGLAELPMVIAYKVDALVARILWFRAQVPSVNLVNIVLDKPVIPERLQYNCQADILTEEMDMLLRDDKKNADMRAHLHRFKQIMTQGVSNPSENAAQILLNLAGASNSVSETQ